MAKLSDSAVNTLTGENGVSLTGLSGLVGVIASILAVTDCTEPEKVAIITSVTWLLGGGLMILVRYVRQIWIESGRIKGAHPSANDFYS